MFFMDGWQLALLILAGGRGWRPWWRTIVLRNPSSKKQVVYSFLLVPVHGNRDMDGENRMGARNSNWSI